MAEEKNDHSTRVARQKAVTGSQEEMAVASVAASWLPTPKTETEFKIIAPKLRASPALSSEAERISVINKALNLAVNYMFKAEKGETPAVVGAKTSGLTIVTEVFGYSPEQISQDEGALADLTEYLIAMVRVAKGIDMRNSKFKRDSSGDPDVELITKINDTWILPEREFDQPFMYQRVNWQKRDLAKGN